MKVLLHFLTALVVLFALLATACRSPAPTAAVAVAPVQPTAAEIVPHDGPFGLRIPKGDRHVAALPGAWDQAMLMAYSPTALLGVTPVTVPKATFVNGGAFFDVALSATSVPVMPALRPSTDYVIDIDLQSVPAATRELEAFGYLFGQTLQAGPNAFTVTMLNNLGVTTPAGVQGVGNGPGANAVFVQPNDVAADGAGNLYVADTKNNMIRKIDALGNVTTLAGNGAAGFRDNAVGANARFDKPEGICFDPVSGALYVADLNNNRVRKVTLAGVVTTVAGASSAAYVDGALGASRFNQPMDVAVDAAGDIYVVDKENQAIRKIDLGTSTVSTLAGTWTLDADGDRVGTAGYVNGAALGTAQFDDPEGVAVDGAGNVYVADTDNNCIRLIAGGNVSTFAGLLTGQSGTANGNGTAARFSGPTKIAISGGNMYVTDQFSHRIRQVVLAPPQAVTTLAGAGNGHTDGDSATARFSNPTGIAADANGIYTTDRRNHAVRKIDLTKLPADPLYVTTVAGSLAAGLVNGAMGTAVFRTVADLALDPAGNMYVTDRENNVIRKIDTAGNVTTLAGTGYSGVLVDGPGVNATFEEPNGICYGADGFLYVADTNNNSIRRVHPVTGDTETWAGNNETYGFADGAWNAARFRTPYDVETDAAGNVYVADTNNHRIRKIAAGSRDVSTFAGGTNGEADGLGTLAQFNYPRFLDFDPWGNLFVADTTNERIRKIDPTGLVSTFCGGALSTTSPAGPANLARFDRPYGIAVDRGGNVHVATRRCIMKVSLDGYATVVAGDPSGTHNYGHVDGTKLPVRFRIPMGIAVTDDGTLYVADRDNHVIRKIK